MSTPSDEAIPTAFHCRIRTGDEVYASTEPDSGLIELCVHPSPIEGSAEAAEHCSVLLPRDVAQDLALDLLGCTLRDADSILRAILAGKVEP